MSLLSDETYIVELGCSSAAQLTALVAHRVICDLCFWKEKSCSLIPFTGYFTRRWIEEYSFGLSCSDFIVDCIRVVSASDGENRSRNISWYL